MSEKIGLVLGSGGARGWVHVGAFQAFEEIGFKPDVIAGCSAGAIIGAAYCLDLMDEMTAFGRQIKNLNALRVFGLRFARGGLITHQPAFETFRYADQNIEDIKIPFGALAADLGTGEQFELTQGSILDAAYASSAIPIFFNAVEKQIDGGSRWLVDGAIVNPVPISLAKKLGATKTIAIDLNGVTRNITRFGAQKSRDVIVRPKKETKLPKRVPEALRNAFERSSDFIDSQVHKNRSRWLSKPHFFESASASLDIIQGQLAELHARIDQPDLRLMPNLADYMPYAFDKHEEMTDIGYQLVMERRAEIEKLMSLQ